MSKTPRARYRTTNWPAYNASLKRRGSLMIWLDPELRWQTVPSGRAGRPAVFSDAAIQFCLTLKGMFGLGLRQAIGLAESLPKLAQFDWNVPDYSTLSRQPDDAECGHHSPFESWWLALVGRQHGCEDAGEGEWKIRKHGADYRGQWRKVHLSVDAQILQIRAIEVTDTDPCD